MHILVTWPDIFRLLLAAFLGGLIGLERESKHRPAGLRTNIFICLGATMFTLISVHLSGGSSETTRIASQIIPGIGFIGAGSIIHARADLVTGITSAATMFVIASIGMAVGGGFYTMAIFTTALVLGVLWLLGLLEGFLNLKVMVYCYEVTGRSAEEVQARVNGVLEPLHSMVANVRVAPTPVHVRVRFECDGTRKKQARIFSLLRDSNAFDSVTALGSVQAE